MKYTLSKTKKSCNISAVLIPCHTGLEIHCPRISPCPRPDQPSILVMEGKGIMSIHGLHEGARKATVNLKLTVWDYGIRSKFQMITWSDQGEMFNHDSGIVTVTQGDLRIESLTSKHKDDWE